MRPRSKRSIKAAKNCAVRKSDCSTFDRLRMNVQSPLAILSPRIGVLHTLGHKPKETPPPNTIPEPSAGLGSPPILPQKPVPHCVNDNSEKSDRIIELPPELQPRNNIGDDDCVMVEEVIDNPPTHYDDDTLRAETDRLYCSEDWRKWGPYLADRQWCTVREDRSIEGATWSYFSHDDSRFKAYVSGEDGLLGITDDQCTLCLGIALWNGKDPILKERLYGLTGPEGNHGEDMKECVYYLDSTPTHSYMKALYKYPQQEFPYQWLVEENGRRDVFKPEFELMNTGIFNDDRYFDVMIEYAKESPDSILIRATITNKGPDTSELHFIPQLWYRNKWSLDRKQGEVDYPSIRAVNDNHVLCHTNDQGRGPLVSHFLVDQGPDGHTMLFCNNETNPAKKHPNEEQTDPKLKHFKDGFHKYIINGDSKAVCDEKIGSKFGAHFKLNIPSKGEVTLKFKLSSNVLIPDNHFGHFFDEIFAARINEANAFYSSIIPGSFSKQERIVARQAYAGLLWNKQYYEFNVNDWLKNGLSSPQPGTHRQLFKDSWPSLNLCRVLSVADKWEYPWYCNWHMGFSVVQLAMVDSKLSMDQLEYILDRDNIGPQHAELPSCEFNFSDVTPPITAWAVLKVFQVAAKNRPEDPSNMRFLKLAFQALTFQFQKWLVKGDSRNKGILAGGFSNLNNIGFFDCNDCNDNYPVEQTDLTCWSLFYCGNLIRIGYELIQNDPDVYDEALAHLCRTYMTLLCVMKRQRIWNENVGLFFNRLRCDKQVYPLFVRSISNLVPIFCCLTMKKEILSDLPLFNEMVTNVDKEKYDQCKDQVSFLDDSLGEQVHLMSAPTALQLKRVLEHVLDENQFLSPFGIRSLSKFHHKAPYEILIKHQKPRTVRYDPGDSTNYLFGGNNNWCGPIWINMNYLIIEALEEYHKYFGSNFTVQCPTGSGKFMNLLEVSQELSKRVARIFLKGKNGMRPCHGMDPLYRHNEHWKDLLLFHESFNGDTGKGIGASHVTGWSALVIDLMSKKHNYK